MTPKTVNLNKLLRLFQLSDQPLKSALRKEIYSEIRKLEGPSGGGGDFHGAFWSDAKMHVRGIANLSARTEDRIERSANRERLYPLLARGFLQWLDEVRRGTNQHVGWQVIEAHNHHVFEDLGLTLKVDNLLPLKIGEDAYRLVYPYFSEVPELSERWARVGLWAMSEALEAFSITDMEIVDVLRGRGFRGTRLSLQGDEEVLFAQRYAQVLEEWDALRGEYSL